VTGPTWTGSLADYERQGLGNVPPPASQPSGMTLQQANPQGPPNAVAPGPINDFMSQFEQVNQAIQQKLAPMARQPLPENAYQPSLFRNILTFGDAGVAAHQYVRAYNTNADAYNRNLYALGMTMAKDLVNSQARSEALRQTANTQDLRTAIMAGNAQTSLLRAQLEDANNKINRRARQTKTPTAEQIRIEALRGRHHDPDDPNADEYGFAPDTPTTSTTLPGEPAAPDSAMKNEQIKLGGGEPQSGQPGGDLAEKLDKAELARKQQEANIKASVPTAATRTMQEAAPKLLQLIARTEQRLKELNTSWLGTKIHAGKTALGLRDPAFQRYQFDVDTTKTMLMRMHVGARGGQDMLEHFAKNLDAGRMDPANMQASLDELRLYAQDVAAGKFPQSPVELGGRTMTPTSSVTTSTAGMPSTGGTTQRLSTGKLIQILPEQ